MVEMSQSDDEEERDMALAELTELRTQREQLWEELLELTIGGEDANRGRCIMEIRAGTGGDEAALFARNLFEMYKKHAERKGWKVELLGSSPTELGGFKEVSLAFDGEAVYREAMPRAERILLTRVDAEPEGDVFFPEVDETVWRCVRSEPHARDERHEYAFTIETWERRD